MSKKLVALLLVLLMLASCLPFALAEGEQKELTIAIFRSRFEQVGTVEYQPWVKRAEEMTGVHVKYIEVEQANQEQLAILLAGDMPDAFFCQLNDNMIASNSSLFVTLDDKIEQYCPTVYALYEDNIPGWREFLTYPDGHIYGLMTGYYNTESNLCGGVQWINTEWLKNVGKEMPTTLDEFYDVLVAFRDMDANGNGDPNDEIPLDFCNAHYGSLFIYYAQMWGMPLYDGTWYDIVDGNVVGAIDTPAFREFLEFFYKLGQEGLMNLEGFSQSFEQYGANIASGRVGTMFAHTAEDYTSDLNITLQYDSVTPFAAEGYTPRRMMNNPINARRNGFMVTTACEDPILALTWFDTISDYDFAHEIARYKEGYYWDYDEEGYMIGHTVSQEQLDAIIAAENLPDGCSPFYGNFFPLILKGLTADVTASIEAKDVRRVIAVRRNQPYFAPHMTQQIVPVEKSEELTFMTDGLNSMVQSFIATSVLHGVTDESWNNFLNDLQTYGYDYYIDWNNKLYHNEL